MEDNTYALHTDLYQINMIYTYWKKGLNKRNSVFEVYFRNNPFGNGYAIFAGLKHIISYISELKFDDSDIEFLRTQDEKYDEEFLTWLKNFKFTGTIRAPHEGEVVFNNEPILQYEGPLAEGQLIETAVLNIINFQTLIATKASRIKQACDGDQVLEFGSRRAHEFDAALWGARAAYIGGFDATSNVRAGKVFDIPVSGTHAHSLVQVYRNDYDAFKAYAETHKNCTFLVDTYDTLRSGVPSAIRVADEMGDKINFNGVRIDSGDIAYISKRVREQLDEAGYPDAKIIVSNDLDENTIQSLKMQHAKVDVWGVGTKLITAFDQPALGAVYKLVSIENENGEMKDTIKLSSNASKVTTPGKKQIWRITNKDKNNKSEGDYVTFADEDPRGYDNLYMFNPKYPYINKTVKNFEAQPILQDIFVDGKLIYKQQSTRGTRKYSMNNLDSLWDEYKRLLNPQEYPVDLSQDLYDHRANYIERVRENVSEMSKED